MNLKGFWLSGPKGSEAIVLTEQLIEPTIKAMAEVDGNDPDDYTATSVVNLDFDIDPAAIVRGPVLGTE